MLRAMTPVLRLSPASRPSPFRPQLSPNPMLWGEFLNMMASAVLRTGEVETNNMNTSTTTRQIVLLAVFVSIFDNSLVSSFFYEFGTLLLKSQMLLLNYRETHRWVSESSDHETPTR
uniref:Uncharacterized protein n=1 Tax=Proboscia inermis TaxID=420281 RepID=A0A7S0C065_9STRA|mmetsp:Transcript_17785/g.18002  ORF Transcript_17785/g.18002 Transcript_17785/m.18002 type:complete len:117 (+) Transcript_17785:216-566(+)